MEKSHKVAQLVSVLFVLVLFTTSMYPVLGAVQRAPDIGVMGTLYGFVTDLNGIAIQDARVEMKPEGDGLSKVAFSQAGLGYYSQALSADTYTIKVTKLGYFGQETTAVIYGGDSVRHDFALEQVPPIDCVLKGKVTNNDTALPVPNADLLLYDIIRNFTRTDTTSLIGNYNISIYAGDFIMFVGKSGFLPRLIGGIHISDGETKTLDFKLFPMPALDARITGDVTYKANNGTTGPVPYARITIYDQERSFFQESQTDANGHLDFNMWQANFVFLVVADNMTFLDSIPRNITALSGQMKVENFKLTELPPGKTITNLDITKWNKQNITMNSTTWGRSNDGGSGPIRNNRFMFDLFFGNGDLVLTKEEAAPYTEVFERDIKNNFELYDTHNLFTVDGIDFIFDKDIKSAFMDVSGSVFGNKPMVINIDLGATSNGTINDKLPTHHIWMNQTYATDDESENITVRFPNIFTFKNITASKDIVIQDLGNGSLKLIPGRNTRNENRTETFTYDLVDNIPPVAKAGLDKVINEDVDTVFDGSSSTDNFGLLYYVWDFGDGTIKNATVPTQAHNYPNPGKYNVTLTVIDLVHLQAVAKISVTVKDVTPPTVKIEVANTTVDEDITIHFKANATDNVGVTNITWAVNGVHTVNGTNFDSMFAKPGKYTVTVNVSDDAKLKTSTFVEMIVRDITSPISNPGNNRTVNESEEVKLDGTGSSDNVGIVSYTWNFGDGSTNITGGTTSHIYNMPGNYTITLNVTDAAGHWNRKSIWVRVKDTALPVVVAQASKITIKKNKPVEFNSTGSHDNVGIVSYSWDFGDGPNTTGSVTTHQYKKAGTYTVNLTAKDAAGNTGKASLTITVQNPPQQQNPFFNAICIGSLLALVFFGGIGAYLVYRRVKLGGYKIEEAFVIYGDGRLIKHISTHPTESADKEVIASMLTAVQDFVKDSLKKKDGEFLGKLEFGKKTKILIERGGKIYLAIVMSGHDPDKLRADLAKTVKQVEHKYKGTLEKWDGDISAFQGLDEMVIELIEH